MYNSIYKGIIKLIDDPMNLGRCKVQIPAIHTLNSIDVNALPWARPIAPNVVNSNRSAYNLPDLEDIVWVLFEGGDIRCPLYIGGTYATSDIVIDDKLVVLYVEGENIILYNREEELYMIRINEVYIEVNKDKIKLIGNTYISENLEVEKNVSIKGSLKVHGNTELDKNLLVHGNILVEGAIEAANMIVRGNTTLNNVTINGEITGLPE